MKYVDPSGYKQCKADAVQGTKSPVEGMGKPNNLAKAGEDLFVGTYSQSRYGNIKLGLNKTHTPHHAVQNAISETTHGRGITINIRKYLHELT